MDPEKLVHEIHLYHIELFGSVDAAIADEATEEIERLADDDKDLVFN